MGKRPRLVCYGLKFLDELNANQLVNPFLEAEIKEAVFYYNDDKAFEPDGFNFRFVKRFWPFLKDDFVDILKNFHENVEFSRGVGSSFITLVPKNTAPTDLGEYQPISSIGVISKVISKVLANRIKVVMGKIISETQSAFISGRHILDGPLMVNEILGWSKRMGKEMFLFKIDFEKAYDNVNWEFFLSQLCIKWVSQIYGVSGYPARRSVVSFSF